MNPQLPIDPFLPQILHAYHHSQRLLIQAEPGAGKSTRLPWYLLRSTKDRMVVLEPRRLAARLTAEYVAACQGEAIGQSVGYQTRFDSQRSQATRLTFMTEGIFTRLLLSQPSLANVEAVVIDEFHERHLHTDIALAFVKHLQETRRPDLKLVVMSATMDTKALETYLDGAQVFTIPGRTYPVDVRYATRFLNTDPYALLPEAVASLATDPQCPGNILAFLPGMREIMRCAEELRPLAERLDLDVLPLTADIGAEAQKRIFASQGRRRLILATNVAETSLTLPGVTGVVDTGLAKMTSYAAWSGLMSLDVKKVSQASCWQRTGRAGRTQAGVCIRLFSEQDFLHRPVYTAPEMERTDLSHTVLEVLRLVDEPEEKGHGRAAAAPERAFATLLPWFETPPARHVETAYQTLQHLEAIDQHGLTERGRRLVDVPLHPRLAAVMLRASELGLESHGKLAAAIISEDFISSGREPAPATDSCDVSYQMELAQKVWHRPRDMSHAEERYLDRAKLKAVERLYHALRGGRAPLPTWDHALLTQALLSGFPDRVARLRKEDAINLNAKKRFFNLCLGRGGILGPSSVCHAGQFILAIDASESQATNDQATGTVIRFASVIDKDSLLAATAPGFRRRELREESDQARHQLVRYATEYYGAIVVDETRQSLGTASLHGEALVAYLRAHWQEVFSDPDALEDYHRRTALLRQHSLGHDWPHFSGEMLELLWWGIADSVNDISELKSKTLRQVINEQLSYEDQQNLARWAPDALMLASKRRHSIHYEVDRSPWLGARIQEFFGTTATPTICDGRQKLTLHLLSPAQRPLQVTEDLAGFWRNTYPKLRQEYMRKYPRHPWPEDPLLPLPPKPPRS